MTIPIIAKGLAAPAGRIVRPVRAFGCAVAAILLAAASLACGSAPGAEPLWNIELPFSHVDRVAAVGDAVVCLGSDAEMRYGYAPCRLVIYGADSGVERYHAVLDLRSFTSGGENDRDGAFLAVDGGMLVVLSQGEKLRGFEASTGRDIWGADDVDRVLAVGDGIILVTGESWNLAAIDAKTGHRTQLQLTMPWTSRVDTRASAAVGRGIAVVANDGVLHGFDTATWRERWTQKVEDGALHLQVAGGYAVATGRTGWVVVDVATGEALWTFEAYPSDRPLPPVISGDRLFTMRGRASNHEIEEGHLRSYAVRSGELIARYPMAPLPEPDAITEWKGRLFMPSAEPHYGAVRRTLIEGSQGDELSKSLDCRISAVDALTGVTVWTGEPATWGSLSMASVSESGLVAVAGMSPRRNKPARLMAYRPPFAR